ITMISIIWWVQAGMVEWLMFDFVVFGFARVDLSELRGGDVEVNVNLVREVLGGAKGVVRDVVVLNVAGVMVVYAGLFSDAKWVPVWEAGLFRAADAIDLGVAEELLARWVRFIQ
ncbi:MAG: hypothetical protein O7C59_11620, partial [Rickettsia endosymbiont of Ixodes persulcatus]|nr:hypothetical protein [Rickettsia endosymbiont of Ixodes persulcatus]